MNQEEKKIKVYLETKGKEDYMCFEFEKEKTVCLTNEDCQNDLKDVFNTLLKELLIQPIRLEYFQNKSFSKGLYIDVCTEYIKDLNREINSVRKKIPEKLEIII